MTDYLAVFLWGFFLGWMLSIPAHAGTGSYNAETRTLYMEGSTDLKLKITTLGVIQRHGSEIEEVVMWGGGGRSTYMVVLMKEIQKLNVPVIIPKGKYCASACALVAVSSDTVIVRGTLLFHMGYVSAYPLKMELGEILTYGQSMAMSISHMLYDIGYKQAFLENLINYTKPGVWYVVTDTKQIEDCKMEGDTAKEYLSMCFITAPIKKNREIQFMVDSKQGSGGH